jgi:hypothetical protein
MATPAQSLQRFQPIPPSPSQILIAQFNAFLEAYNISIRSRTTIHSAQIVIEVIRKRMNAHIPQIGSDEQRIQHYIDTAYAVIYGSSVKDIATDHGIAPDGVRRIVNVIGVAVKIFFGHCDTVHGRAVNIWAILDPYRPIAVDATLPWPTEVKLHASALRDAVDRLHGPCLKPGLVAVSIKNLKNIRNGAALLSQSLGNANRHFQTAAQAVVHNNQAAYLSSSGYHWVIPPMLPAPPSAREQSVGYGLEHKVISSQNNAITASHRNNQHTDAQQKSVVDSQGLTARSRYPSVEHSPRLSPLKSFDSGRSQIAKRAVPRSRDTSPVQKRSRKGFIGDDNFEAYKLFVLAERSRLETEFPSIAGQQLAPFISIAPANIPQVAR